MEGEGKCKTTVIIRLSRQGAETLTDPLYVATTDPVMMNFQDFLWLWHMFPGRNGVPFTKQTKDSAEVQSLNNLTNHSTEQGGMQNE